MRLAPIVAYQESTGPLSYQAPTGADTDRGAPRAQVSGEACQAGLQFPLGLLIRFASSGNATSSVASLSAGWGNGGYSEAVADASRKAQGGLLYDLKADVHTTMVLGIYRKECVVVHAAVADPPSLPQAVPAPSATTPP